MSTLDTAIDDLYRLPLNEFTAARNVLAKTLAPPDKAAVQRLGKPTVVPWAVNQLFWAARPAYDRVMKAGAALRAAQIEALEGKPSRVAKATDSHREALRDATTRALALGAKHDTKLPADDVSRMIETLSLAANPPAHPGRLTELAQPSGFEALAGLDPARIAAAPRPPARREPASQPETSPAPRPAEQAALRAKAETALAAAESRLARWKAQEARAEQSLAAAQQKVADAEESLATARTAVRDAEQDVAGARSELAALPAPSASRGRQPGRV